MIKVSRGELARGLKLAASIADRKSTAPMMACVLLRADAKGKRLSIAATDLAVSLTAELPAEVDKPAAIALKADDVARFVAGATGDVVSIEVADRNVADIRCGRAKYRIAGYPDRDFPKVPQPGDGAVECDAAALREMLERASYAVSPDENRTHITGVGLEVGAESSMLASTDGHRMVRIKRGVKLPRPKGGTVIVNGRGAREILRLLDGAERCTVSLDAPRRLYVSVGGLTVSAALIDATFPPIEHVIPKEHKASLEINRDRLIESLKRVSPLATDMRPLVLTPHEGGLTLTTADSEGQELSDEIEATTNGKPVTFGCCLKYALESVQHMTGDTVTIRTLGELDPIVFLDNGDTGVTGVVMPMRVS